MIEILIQKKDEILNQMIEVNPELQEQYEKNNEIYQKILQSKKEYQNKADGISKAWLHFYE
jgi:ABC-type Zn uptake system ZnuABC Zn-binding protein ZnuA